MCEVHYLSIQLSMSPDEVHVLRILRILFKKNQLSVRGDWIYGCLYLSIKADIRVHVARGTVLFLVHTFS